MLIGNGSYYHLRRGGWLERMLANFGNPGRAPLSVRQAAVVAFFFRLAKVLFATPVM